MTRVLVVDDEVALARALAINLRARGFEVEIASTGAAALDLVARFHPDVVVLDLGLPDMDGIEVLQGIRGWSPVPVLVLSARTTGDEKVEALDHGADDYVTKPFGMDELRARIRVALRRAAGPGGGQEGRIAVGPLVLDAAAHEVRIDGRAADLTPREFELLRVLLTHRGRVVTKGRLLRAVWGEAYQAEDSYVYVHVSQLRRKLAAADPGGRLDGLIRTEPGVGYRIGEVPDLVADADVVATDAGPLGKP